METIKLYNGVEMPKIGMGTYPLRGKELLLILQNAYTIGYRLFDTADNYYNEEDLGLALEHLYSTTDAQRKDMFLITKLSDELYEPGTLGGGANKGLYFWKSSPIMQQTNAVRKIVEQKVANSLEALKTDYLDALLMHWPYPDCFEEIWFEMEQVYNKGLVRAIGVCNCRERHLEKLKTTCSIRPMINQFESSPLNTKQELKSYCDANKIQVMTYSPLMNIRFAHNEYKEYLEYLSKKYRKDNAQIILRFDIQRGLIPIPKSSHAERLKTNFDIFDFQLQESEMEKLYGFNVDLQTLPESRSCPGL